MRKIKLYDKEYWIDGSGETMFIYMNEFHLDLFEEMSAYLISNARGMLSAAVGSRLAYAMIKTANPDVVNKGYEEFVKGFKSIGAFVTTEHFIKPMLDEITDLMETGEPKDTDAKKNRTPEEN